MKKIITTVLALSCVIANAQEYKGKLGINTHEPDATVDFRVNAENAEDGETTNEGLLIPRLKKSRVGSMADPQNSTLVYVDTVDTSSDPRVANIKETGFYFFDKPNNTWKPLGGGGTTTNQSQTLSATYVGATGTWMQDIATNGNSITFRVANTSSYSFAGLDFNQALTLNGASQGLTYTPAEDYSSVSFNVKETKTFVYNISGTPRTHGTLTANLNTNGLSAFGNIPVQEASQTKAMSIEFAGNYQAQKPLTSANTITLKVHNFTTQAVNGVDMSNAINLTGIDGVSIVPNQNTSVNFPAGQTTTLTYTLTGTPSTSGTLLAGYNANLSVAGNISGNQAVGEVTGISSTAISFDGDYFVGQKMENTNVVKITLSNANNYPIGNLNLSQVLSLSDIGASGVSVGANQNTAVSIPANGTQVITYTLTGTPTQAGTITAHWAYSYITGTQTASRQIDQWEVTPETIIVTNTTQNNSDFTINIKSSEPWGAELVNGGTNPWIKNIRTNNTSGNGTVLFDTEPHDTTTPSGYKIRVYKTSDPSNGKYVYVLQQAGTGGDFNVTLSTTYFDIAGQTQEIETNYNGTITVISKPDWITNITQVGTKLQVTSAPRTDVGARKSGGLVLEFGPGYRKSYSGILVQRQKANVCPTDKPDWVPTKVQYYKLANGETLPGGTIVWTEYIGDNVTASTYKSGAATMNMGIMDGGEWIVGYERKSAIVNGTSSMPSNIEEIYILLNGGKIPKMSRYNNTPTTNDTTFTVGHGSTKSTSSDLRAVICVEYKDNY